MRTAPLLRTAGLRRFVPALLWAVAIFLVSNQSRLPEPPLSFDGLDKVLHALVYGVLAALLLWGARHPRGRAVFLWASVAAIYGATDEWHQSFVPNRDADLWDLLADVAGAFVVAGLWLRFGVAPDRAGRAATASAE